MDDIPAALALAKGYTLDLRRTASGWDASVRRFYRILDGPLGPTYSGTGTSPVLAVQTALKSRSARGRGSEPAKR